MIAKVDKNSVRQSRHTRVRGRVSGTAESPRLNVYRSLKGISVQVIDDTTGFTLCACSTYEKSMKELLNGKTKVEQAAIVGAEIAKRASAKSITSVVFDRGGYLYIGRVKSLADGARAAGLQF